MASNFMRCCRRTQLLGSTPHYTLQSPHKPILNRPFTTSTHRNDNGNDLGVGFEEVAPRTRLSPLSPSYYTGSPEYYDNLLALQDLLRKHQALPTLHGDQVPDVQWKTIKEYREIVGSRVRPSRYNRVVRILDRLNRIDPELLPPDTKRAISMYVRPENPEMKKAPPRPVDGYGRAYAIGRRKTSVARVFLVEGDGEVMVNGMPIIQKFQRIHDRESVLWPLLVTKRMDKYNIFAVVKGGGKTGQAEACTLAIARALRIQEPALKQVLRAGRRIASLTPAVGWLCTNRFL